MNDMERRVFLKGASMGMLAFAVGGVEILMTPGDARARAVPFRLLNADEAETLEALREARIVNVKPPFINFYRAAIGGTNKAAIARSGKRFAALSATEQHDFIDQLRQNKIEGWQGPPAGLVYFVLRSDAVDVVYGTMEGYESLGVPYMAHIEPDKRW